ncbi:MAG TPA: acyl-CoA dehydrogenase family protein [Candidatus Cybelea sp.]|nr:acyl-CoA dehydrogenase family protein [Candidatus Cybelea sp.]
MTELDITFGDEQALILETAQNFARQNSSPLGVRKLFGSDLGYDQAVWRQMAELGWTGLVVPEAQGGSGLGAGDAVSIVEAFGRHLLASPLVPALLAARALAECANQHEGAAQCLTKIAAGSIATVALSEPGQGWNLRQPSCKAERSGGGRIALSGRKCHVPFASVADAIVTTVTFEGSPQLLLLSRSDIPPGALRREICVDESQRVFRVSLDGLTVDARGMLPARESGIEALIRDATLLLTAEMCGGIAGALDTTLEYLKTRKQFGRLIGSYQALKHPVVDIYTHYELLRSLLYGAATAAGGDKAWRLTQMAKAKASDLFVHAGDRAVQFHGGFGFTHDCDAGLYLRRAMWAQSQLGDGAFHRCSLADQLLV